MTGNELVNTGPVPDDPDRTEQALTLLQSGDRPFLVRSYVIYRGHGQTSNQTPSDPVRYLRNGRRLDFVICYRSEDSDLADWTRFVRDTVRRYGPHLDALQVTEEPNNPHADSGGAASIPPAVPVRVTENGWPTGPGRPPERQAEVLETLVRTIHRHRAALNVTHYEFFLLRDGDSDRTEVGYQFGLLRHNYTPKPGFEAYRRLIAELGA